MYSVLCSSLRASSAYSVMAAQLGASSSGRGIVTAASAACQGTGWAATASVLRSGPQRIYACRRAAPSVARRGITGSSSACCSATSGDATSTEAAPPAPYETAKLLFKPRSNFCRMCGTAMAHKRPEGEREVRHVCPSCNTVEYFNPKVSGNRLLYI